MKAVPEIAILQNDKTRNSAVWSKETGKWTEFNSDEEYACLLVIVNMLRHSPHPNDTAKSIIKTIKELEKDN